MGMVTNFSRYFRTDFVRNIGVLLSGAVFAQIIPVLATPILSRVYTPSDFGVYSIFYGIVASVSTIASLRLDYAIVMQKNRSRAFHLLVVSCLVAIATAVVAFIVLTSVVTSSPQWLGVDGTNLIEQIVYIFLFVISLLSWSFINNLTYYLNNLKDYKAIASNKTVRAVTTSIGQIITSFFAVGGLGLLWGLTFGMLSSFIFLIRKVKRRGLLSFQSFHERFARALVVANSRFAAYNAPHILVDMMLLHGLIILVSMFYSTEDVGNLGFVNRLIRIPASLIGSVVGSVLFQSLSEKIARRESISAEVKAAMKLLTVCIVPAFFVYPFIENLFVVVFGEQWSKAAELTIVLMPAMLINLMVLPFTNLAYSLKRNKTFFMVSIFNGSLIVLGCIIASFLCDFKCFIYVYGILQAICFFVTGWWLLSLYRSYEQMISVKI
ncbi:MAG: oligosaccharide flippase family protein [Flavobacteriales bacterium]|nr:oligosaccharide flippase family protein [Flavobacteriales bacterium]